MTITFQNNGTTHYDIMHFVVAHSNLYQNSITYKNMVDDINDGSTGNSNGSSVTVTIGSGDYFRPASSKYGDFDGDGASDDTNIFIPIEFLQNTDYVTTNNWTSDIQTIERVLAHEMTHAWQRSVGADQSDDGHEWDAVDQENQVMQEYTNGGETDKIHEPHLPYVVEDPTLPGSPISMTTETRDGTNGYDVYSSNPSDPSNPTVVQSTNPPSYTPPPGGDDPFGGWDPNNPSPPPPPPPRTWGGFIEDLWTSFLEWLGLASPLILDLDNSGTIDLKSKENSDAFFDIDGDGFAEETGWIDGSSGDGFLVWDKNADGQINDNSELFGNSEEEGFKELALLDSNLDGMINSLDNEWGSLEIWVDSNENGFTESGELHSLSSYSIESISLANTRVDQTVAGNIITNEGSFTYSGGSTGKIVDAWFSYNQSNTHYNESFVLDIDAAIMPDLRGYGEIADLSVAMSIDNDTGGLLEDMFDTFVNKSLVDLMASNSLVEDTRAFLHRWAGVDSISPTSRGAYVDARDLGFIEKLLGEPFLQHGYEPNPGVQASKEITSGFFDVLMEFGSKILLQVNGSMLFDNYTHYDYLADSFEDPGSLSSIILDDLETVASDPANDSMTVWTNVLFFVTGVRGGDQSLTTADINALDTAIQNSDVTLSYADVHANLHGIEAGALNLSGDSSDNLMNGSVYGDTIQSQYGNDTVYGHGGDDYITTGHGDDIAYGGDGHDEVYNVGGNDIFYGGAGADLFRSGTGNDTYVFNVGDGDDTIVESYSTTAVDRIEFGTGITLSDLTFTRVSNEDLLITIATSAGGGSILVDGHFDSTADDIDEIVFADSSTFDPESINYTLHATDNAELQLNGVHSGSDDDTIYGHGGNDRIFGYQGADNLYGGDGDDTIYAYDTTGEYYDIHAHVLDGGAGNDLIHAADGADDITGGTGNDNLYGYSGNDTYTFNYGDGNDTLEDDSGTADVIELGSGITQADLTYDLSERDDLRIIIDGGAGGSIFINRMFYNANYHVESLVLADSTVIDLIYQDYEWSGSNGADILYGRDFDLSVDTIHGLDGNDNIYGEKGDDVLYGDGGDDYIVGDYGDDTVYGGAGVDTIRGNNGDDVLHGGDGNDDVRGGNDDDIISGGLGDDYLNGEGGTGDILDYGNAASGVVVNLETRVATGEGTDTLFNFEYAHGSANDDTFSQASGSKGFDGKGGIDTLDLSAGYRSNSYASVDLASGTATGYFLNLTIANIENVIGRDGNDTLTGDANANQLEGRDGNDVISGADGDDLLYGGNGNDTITGGNGADTVFFLDGETGIDTITDFTTGDGDALNLADMLSLYDPLTDLLTDFVEITDSGSDSIVKIDQDGGANSFVQIATLTGVTGLTDEDALEAAGNLLVA